MLDDAGVLWRVIVVSACYSGGFIEPLETEHTLIMTATLSGPVASGLAGPGAREQDPTVQR